MTSDYGCMLQFGSVFLKLDGTLGEFEFCESVFCALDFKGLRNVNLLAQLDQSRDPGSFGHGSCPEVLQVDR